MKKKLLIAAASCCALLAATFCLLYFAGGFFHSVSCRVTDADGRELYHWRVDWKGTLTVGGNVDMEGRISEESIEYFYYERGYRHITASEIIRRIVVEEGVTGLSENAFCGLRRVREIILPQSVTIIRDHAFSNTAIRSIRIPAAAAEIDGGAFIGCGKLADIRLDENNRHFKLDGNLLLSRDGTVLTRYFDRADETSFTVPESVRSIGDRCFGGASYLKELTVPEGVLQIGDEAFVYCGELTAITLPDTAEHLGNAMFQFCEKLTDVRLPSGLAELPDLGCFHFCKSLEKVELPAALKVIPDSAFFCSGLRELTVPEGTEQIGWAAFYNCEALEKLSIPASVTRIESGAFLDCAALREIRFGGTREQWETLLHGADTGLRKEVAIHFANK